MGNGSGVAAVSTLPPPSKASQQHRERLFFSSMSVAVVLAVVVGFAPTYFLKGVYGGQALSPLLHHGALFTGVASQVARLAIANTAAWLSIAEWLTRSASPDRAELSSIRA